MLETQTDEQSSTDIKIERGLMQATDSRELSKIMQGYVLGGHLPAQYCVTEQVPLHQAVRRAIFAHQLLTGMGVPVLPYMRFVAYIGNAPHLWGDLPLTLVKRSGKLKGNPNEYWLTEGGERIGLSEGNFRAKKFAGVCEMTTLDGTTHQRIFTLEDAQTAQVMRNPTWTRYPARMLQMKARGWLIKDIFPEVLCGGRQLEYDADTAADESGRVIDAGPVVETTPVRRGERKSDLGELFAEGGEA